MLLRDKLKQDITLLDGGFGTTVEAYGYDVKHELWSTHLIKEHPEAILKVHQAFVNNGAEIILTNTYQGAVQSFLNTGYTEREAEGYLQAAVELAHQSVSSNVLVAASLGPYGAMLGNGSEYTGAYQVRQSDYIEYHMQRLNILIEAGIRVFAFETIPNIEEVKAVKALLEDYPDIEAWLSVTLKDSAHLSDGTPIEEVIEVVNGIDNVHAFGVNCTSVKVIDGAVERLLALSEKAIILYPNGGRKYDAVEKVWIDQDDISLIEATVKWKQLGVKIIGGCCQVGPEEIGALSAVLKGK
ncbi:homocysteine S-methyltransferase [Macrococcus capreoli]